MKELIKRNVFIFIIMTICFFPASISAKTVSFNELRENKMLEPGDVIDFTSAYDYYSDKIVHLYLEGELISQNCFGRTQDCNLQYIVQQRMVLYDYNYYNYNTQQNIEDADYYYYKMGSNQELLIIDDDITSGYYKTGDIIFFKTQYYEKTAYFYDDNENLSQMYVFGSNLKHIVYRLPKINNKDMYWSVSVFDDGAYHSPCPHFTPFDYKEPKIELKCDKDKINYGEKTKCEVCIECTHALNKLNFSMNQKDLKFTNYNFSNGITNTGNDNSIKLNISDDSICSEKRVVMTFDVEGTKDSTYLNKLSLNNIEYTDELLTAKYNDLDSDLNIISTNSTNIIISNPNTGTRMIFIIIPVILLPIIGGFNFIRRKRYEK